VKFHIHRSLAYIQILYDCFFMFNALNVAVVQNFELTSGEVQEMGLSTNGHIPR
jgi:hypothetical protein